MKERPILFSGPMVRAILDGRKTMTRRVVDLNYAQYDTDGVLGYEDAHGDHHNTIDLYKYGRPGDRLWVRETWKTFEREDDGFDGILYRADGAFRPIDNTPDAADAWVEANHGHHKHDHWRPSIFMRRWMSRITLDVLDVRVERLQQMDHADATAEGVTALEGYHDDGSGTPRGKFRVLWDSINGKRKGCAWADNPWVWVVAFRRVAP